MLQELDKTLQTIHTKPSLAKTIKQMVCQVIGLQHKRLHNIVWTSQAKIGVYAIFDGQMSKEWARDQDEYLVVVKLWTQRTNGSQRTVQVIKFLWDRFFELWKKHNEVVHGKEGKAKMAAQQA
eukprot:4653420-Ditylum_brightwellii.AAC.1